MADLKLKCVTQPAGYAWVVGWKYEIFKEGDEDPFAIGYYFGTRAEADAAAAFSMNGRATANKPGRRGYRYFEERPTPE
jgi:hypothetical protein